MLPCCTDGESAVNILVVVVVVVVVVVAAAPT
jgi:hypothetical protein